MVRALDPLSRSPRALGDRARRVIAKARGRNPRYLAWKASTLAWRRVRPVLPGLDRAVAARDVVANALGQEGSARDHLGSRPFFLRHDEVDTLVALLTAQDPEYRHGVVVRADDVRRHRISILSVGPVDLGPIIDWHRDYRSGLSWEVEPAERIDFLDLGRPSDVRIVWELNRLHFLVDLGKAFRVTGDQAYARTARDLITAWDEANPVGMGVNWTVAMEAAIRAINLVWTVFLLLPSPVLDERFLRRLLEMLYEHGWFIRRNLEYSDVRGNHYLADLVGLVWIGLFLPEVPAAGRWLRYALPRFEREILHQVHADGSTHEGSIPYHRLVMELFLATALLLRANHRSLPRHFWTRLERMADFVAAYTKPDGTCPLFGDTDDGRLFVLGSQGVNDHRYLLTVMAAHARRPELKHRAGQLWEEAAWILGPDGSRAFRDLSGEPQVVDSRGFPDGGWFFLRHGHSYAAIDCGDVGLRGQGGHGHCDVLSVELALGGDSVVVDTGSCLYTASGDDRVRTLRDGAHNSVVVDGRDHADIVPYDIASVRPTPSRVLRWEPALDRTLFEGEHRGYSSIGIVHRRSIQLTAATGSLVITDRLMGSDRHTLQARFALAPGLHPQIRGQVCDIRSPGGHHVLVETDRSTGQWMVQPTTVFPSYGRAAATTAVIWQEDADLPCTLVFRWRATSEEQRGFAGAVGS